MNIGIKLKRLSEENFIWIIYAFIVLAALYSNHYAEIYYKTNNKFYRKKEKTINIIVLVIAFFIYLYFVLIITDDFNNMEQNFNNQEYLQTLAKLVAAILFLIAGAIYAIVEITNVDTDELAII